ncbi:MAG: sigma 54-interacting transcriptional regulator [Clostridium sp.]
MNNLEEIRPSVERLVSAIANSLNLEVAIFGSDSQLFFCTPTYLKKKGNIVHTPFIRDVILSGSVLVNTPGEMPSCIGCRFKDHCPSTIEVLCCIRAGTDIVGVADFTSFTKEGQRRISENTEVYLNAITELATLIGEYVLNKTGNINSANMDHLITGAMEICSQPLLLTDPHGIILQYNRMADSVLKFCDTSSASLWQLFPRDIVEKITTGNDLYEKPVMIGKMETKVTTRTITVDDQNNAIFVRLSDEIYEPASDAGFFVDLKGESPEMKTMRRLIKRVSSSPTPLLITGETGTGKELVARAIHEQSSRNKYPFVAINCSSIPENLFESELFGYDEGSFTGAKKGGKVGKIELAQGGTLFLDELGEMPLAAQPKLLRVLQEYELERVGSNKKVQLDIRIITATNKKLTDMIAAGKFREDLFYRISVINIKLPPLRRRKGDIMPIALNYLEKLKTKIDTPLKNISEEVTALFLDYSWPGNVRELQNVMEHAANLCDSDTMMCSDLPESMLNNLHSEPVKPVFPVSADTQEKDLRELLGKYGYTLEGKKQIALQLGISLRTLYRKIDKLSL